LMITGWGVSSLTCTYRLEKIWSSVRRGSREGRRNLSKGSQGARAVLRKREIPRRKLVSKNRFLKDQKPLQEKPQEGGA